MKQKIATRDAYGEVLVELGKKNSSIVVLDADLSKSTKTADFKEVFPQRFFNMGVAEADMMGTAAGFAAAGLLPFASTFAVFAAGRAYDQVRNSIAYTGLNVKIVATHAGITVGEDGSSHQSVEDIAIMRVMPNMTVIVPADGPETKKAVEAAVELNGPVYVRLGRMGVPVLFSEEEPFVIGKGKIIKDGSDITIIAIGIMVSIALEAAETLLQQGVKARVINLPTLKPLDEEIIIRAAQETGGIITAEEHSIIGGLGGAVSEVTAENCPVPVKRVGVRDTFGESGSPELLLEKYGLTSKNIVKAAQELLNKR
ncbi:transketolase family protein [Candidatus Contubernalis alkaliaceticus]|uniref:transketolase family protein n=1 Tax=Candidatus Contubernalis alkaliaceticus TaxID=338645 RepID=UPI001F4C1244|nr:transketolase family protein [Candidatus Contubernalis alkalaceticus]UNC90773.1 transketolase family protein [Candidatus Contubernalis alkalaceticus]